MTTSTHEADREIRLDTSRLVTIVVLASAVVIALGILREVVMLQIGYDTPLKELRHFALDSELALPSWYSTIILFVCAGLFYLVGRATRAEAGRDWTRWMMLAVIFLLMSLDEAASFHESLMRPMQAVFDTSGIFLYAWVIPGAIGVLGLGLFFLPFVMRLPRTTALLIVAAGALYVGGALGLELAGGAADDAWSKASLPYIVVSVLEESLEIAGLSVLVIALCAHMRDQWGALNVSIVAQQPSEAPRTSGQPVEAR